MKLDGFNNAGFISALILALLLPDLLGGVDWHGQDSSTKHEQSLQHIATQDDNTAACHQPSAEDICSVHCTAGACGSAFIGVTSSMMIPPGFVRYYHSLLAIPDPPVELIQRPPLYRV